MRSFVAARTLVVALVVALTFNSPLLGQTKTQTSKAEPTRTNGAVHSVNGVQGDVTLTGGGGLVVSQDGNTITVSAPTTLGVGRSEPDPKYALDVGGTGVVRIGNSIYLDGVSNTVTTSTGTLNFTSSNLTTTGTISGDGSGLTGISFGALTSGQNGNLLVATNPKNAFYGSFFGGLVGTLQGNATSASTAALANGLASGTFGNVYHFTNDANTYRGTFLGTFNGNAASATTANTANTANTATTANTALSLASGQHQGEYAFTSAANQFTGTFIGNLSGRASTADSATTASTATTAGIANDLAGGTFGNLYHFTNTGNTYQGTFLGNFNGKATTAGTADVAKTLLGGQHTAQYDFSHLANRFVGNFVGNLQGNAQTATTAQNATNAVNATNAQNAVSAQNATTATTAQTATTLAAGQHNGVYNFTSQSNIYRGTFIGDGSQLTGVSTSGLAAGTYGNAYQFSNSGNTFAGSFTGSLDGNAATATTATNATNATNAQTAATATTLAGGTHSAAYVFDNGANSFSGSFIGDGSQLTGVVSSDDTRVLKSGDIMTGQLELSAEGIRFADGTTMTTSATPQGWSLSGNGNVTSDQFVGTTDGAPLQLRVAGVNALRILPPTNGYINQMADAPMIIGGAAENIIHNNSDGSVIGGGGSTVQPNQIFGEFAVVGGGRGNAVGSNFSVVAGGELNFAGFDNTYTSNAGQRQYATVSGGMGNHASGSLSVVAGGYNNQTGGVASAVSGGVENHAGGDNAAVAGGANNIAEGDSSFVAGGLNNYAFGDASFAAGQDALAEHANSFVFNDGTAVLQSQAPGEFVVRATGGYRFHTSAIGSSGVRLTPGGGSWSNMSDRNAKKDLEAVDGEAVLRALAGVPVWRWSYKTEADGIRHMGPTAQDFRAAFSLGDDDKSIATVDADGVNLAAIQALEKRTVKLQEENASLKREIETLRTLQQQMLQRMEEILRERR